MLESIADLFFLIGCVGFAIGLVGMYSLRGTWVHQYGPWAFLVAVPALCVFLALETLRRVLH